MKRITAVFLTLVMLVTVLPISTMASNEKIEEKPFYFVNISTTEAELPYTYAMPQFYTSTPNEQTQWLKVSYQGETMTWDIAEKLKIQYDSQPEGTRYINFSLVQKAYHRLVENSIYMEKPATLVKDWLEDFLMEYSSIGGKLDGLSLDLEYNYASSYYIGQRYDGRGGNEVDKDVYNDIVNDPRYATQVRPLLEEQGFLFWEEDDNHPEIWSIYPRLSGAAATKYASSRTLWDKIMQVRLRDYMNEYVYEPLIKYYPDAKVSDYRRTDMGAWYKDITQHGGISGNTLKVGNTSNINMYCNFIQRAFYEQSGKRVYGSLPGYNKAEYQPTAFNMCMYYANNMKNVYAATDNKKVNVYVSGYSYINGGSYGETVSNSPYYTEALYHIGLMNPDPFLGWVTTNSTEGQYEKCMKTVSDIMVELTRVAGYADRKPIELPANWNGEYVLSGMYAGGRNIWRLTPNTNEVSLETFKVKDNEPMFVIDGQTITFPQGKIIEDGTVSNLGSCGYWIETPANVTPVITSSAERYRENPAYLSDFEGYSENSAFTGATALPELCWNVTGDLSIQSVEGNKKLAVMGTASATNVNLPKNVTAGDYYAKQQAWEVSVTLPEGLSANAEIKLLSSGENDGGICIKGGAVSYANGSRYETMPNVSLSAGTYTFKREVDFRTEGAFSADYYVYDESGKLLGQVQDAPMVSFTLPVQEITLSGKGIDKTVYLDDYKLYATGLTAVLEAYETDYYGGKLEDGTVRTEDTAYRVSWLNGSAEYKVAYVYNALDGSILRKIEMAPGQDGVVTGIVELEDGKSVKLALKTVTVEPPKSDDTSNDGSDTPNTPVTPDSDGGSEEQPDVPDNTQDVEDTTTAAPDENTVPQPSDDPTDPDEKKGLGGGVIALIVFGGVLVLGGGGFALYWFVIRGREEQLLAKLKRLFKR